MPAFANPPVMNIRSPWLLLTVIIAIGTVPLQGAIEDFKELTIDLTNEKEAGEKSTWFPADMVTVTAGGLGWDGETAASRDGWIQTKPMAVGLSWRAPSSVSLRVEISPAPVTFTMSNGQKATPWAGQAFARYSPDAMHWSSWQALARDPQKPEVRAFAGQLSVPQRERREYGDFLAEYSKLDVPWKSDEEAAVAWILKRSPDFFARSLPFIGYVEFLFEFPFQGGQRLKRLQGVAMCGMSGLHFPPKDESVFNERENLPWRFKAQ